MLVVVGGTGLNQLPGFSVAREELVVTPYQTAPVAILCGTLADCKTEIAFLPRHGARHSVPPHIINYRANIFALRELGTTAVLAVNAVGGINKNMGPGVIAVPRQIIDYTYGRAHTFFDGQVIALESADKLSASVTHIDFTEPYDAGLRALLVRSAAEQNIAVWPDGVYGATQGPRLETPAEIKRLQRDGCDMVGMTGMPEAALAREAGLPYACMALSVNWGAGLTDDVITMDGIRQILSQGMGNIRAVLLQAAKLYSKAAESAGSGGGV
ncbi:MAG: S-methyl-5'-thioinosine phosphorylase [Pseudohongiella sp.]|nr:S-methyl-5'-thioinosine phosphorylase [Pseudohongiella sp.]